jgi:hypothetical protein
VSLLEGAVNLQFTSSENMLGGNAGIEFVAMDDDKGATFRVTIRQRSRE